MSEILTIAGSTVVETSGKGWVWQTNPYNAALDRCAPLIRGGIPELHFSRILGTLKPASGPALPDPWSAQPVTLTLSGILIFVGDVVGYVDRFMDSIGWVREYRCLGLRNRADYIPNTDSETLTDTSVYNLPGDDPSFIGSRAGLTVGQIVTQVLTGGPNASALNAAGIGAYASSMPSWTLPTLTVADLAALTVVPPWRVAISGERILQSLEQFVQTCHPNHWLHVQPDGTIRFLDMRSPTNNTLTLGGDARLGMPQLTRDYSDCYSQVEVRGNTLAVAMTLQTEPWPGSSSSDGGLQEDFAWGSYTNTQAKNNWVPADFTQPTIGAGNATDTGSCTCPDTQHVVVTSNNNTLTWAANYWSQAGTEAQGVIYLYADSISGISQLYQARIVANTALTAGGSSTLTLDRTLPAVTYNSYQIWGMAAGASVVWRKYKVTNPNIAAAMLPFFPYPVPIATSVVSNGAALTSTPAGFYYYPQNGTSAPYNLGTQSITLDPTNGLIYFDRPTAVIAGTTVVKPVNVIAFVPVATGALNVIVPSSGGSPGYAGTCYTVEGIQRTKIITVRDWTDASQNLNMTTFANEYLGSVDNVVVEGSFTYYGLLTQFLTCGTSGQGVSITGTSGATPYTTGWDAMNLPVVSAEVLFNSGPQGTSYQMNVGLSNRRGRYSADQFLRPGVSQVQLGVGDTFAAAGAQVIANAWTESGLGGLGASKFSAANVPTPPPDTRPQQQLAAAQGQVSETGGDIASQIATNQANNSAAQWSPIGGAGSDFSPATGPSY
jgi:hypothetical protein